MITQSEICDGEAMWWPAIEIQTRRETSSKMAIGTWRHDIPVSAQGSGGKKELICYHSILYYFIIIRQMTPNAVLYSLCSDPSVSTLTTSVNIVLPLILRDQNAAHITGGTEPHSPLSTFV